ncbi:hypothetical protein H2248_011749 [Termitomyces sp. 'cryptogamus']|nr:hypothetical protein H2248_011749 [Termitomyces sp. 'cryptogamus']
MYIGFGSDVVSDILIAIFLCINLWHHHTGFKRAKSLVKKLMMYTINTALLTTICCTICFISYTLWPNNFVFIALYFLVSNLFVNCLLASLNNREALSKQTDAIHHISISTNTHLPGQKWGLGPNLPDTSIEPAESRGRLDMSMSLGTSLQTNHIQT